MKASFVCDVHIPPRLAAWLRAQGFEAIHVFEAGLGDTSDAAIWEYATTRNAIVVTKDNDFVRLDLSRPGAKVILVCTGNCSNKVLMEKFESLLPSILAHLEAGKRVVELR